MKALLCALLVAIGLAGITGATALAQPGPILIPHRNPVQHPGGACVESTDLTTITAPNTTSLITGPAPTCVRWQLSNQSASPDVVLRNNALAGFAANVQFLVWHNHTAYQMNCAVPTGTTTCTSANFGSWWLWDGTSPWLATTNPFGIAASLTATDNGDGTFTLTWACTNSTSATGTWVGGTLATSGTASVSPVSTTTYTVKCTGAHGVWQTASATATVGTGSGPIPRAWDLTDRWGFNFPAISNAGPDTVAGAMNFVGLHHIRTSLNGDPGAGCDWGTTFGTFGMHVLLLTDASDYFVNGAQSVADRELRLFNCVNGNVPGTIDEVEGTNECGTYGQPIINNQSDCVNIQTHIYNTYKAAHPNLFVWNYSEGSFFPENNLGNIADGCNLHPYSDRVSGDLYNNLTWQVADCVNQILPGKIVMYGEFGFCSNDCIDHPGFNDDLKGKYGVNQLLDQQLKFPDGGLPPWGRSYIFGLAMPDYNDGFGWFNLDFTPKQSGQWLANLVAILHDPGVSARTFATSGLGYSISGLCGLCYKGIVQKSNGAWDIIVWNENSIWDNGAEHGIASTNITVNLPSSKPWKLYDYTQGTGVRAAGTGASVPIALNDHAMVLEVGP